jgi:hypothetical protein
MQSAPPRPRASTSYLTRRIARCYRDFDDRYERDFDDYYDFDDRYDYDDRYDHDFDDWYDFD